MEINHQISKELNKKFRNENTNLKNRLHSILLDYDYIKNYILPTYYPKFPIIPNQRCGLWYLPPELYCSLNASVYFKSTDGHTNIWEFSTRRTNFHLFQILLNGNGSSGSGSGVVIVDSTRRGKKLPDSLSKTIPIWCSVINCIMNGNDNQNSDDLGLYLPPETVSATEAGQIRQKITFLVQKIKEKFPQIVKTCQAFKNDSSHNNVSRVILRPIWCYPGSKMNMDPFTGKIIPWENTNSNDAKSDVKIYTIVCCCCSYQCQDGIDKRNGFTYVQGAADDHESWSHGLEPLDFWFNLEKLGDIRKSDEELISLIKNEIKQKTLRNIISPVNNTCEIVKDAIYLSSALAKIPISYSLVINCSSKILEASDNNTVVKNYPTLISGSKKSGKLLRSLLIEIVPIIELALSKCNNDISSDGPILISCDTGTDIAPGIILTILSLHFEILDDDHGWGNYSDSKKDISKTVIKQHLIKLIDQCSPFYQINPSRATLNSVNAFLM
ncbi:tRNA A64-2'-O-ribosylphosphate transferase SCDLUD_001260 [Saccharomycodes ludwigii]|uniref:tRNA A64-2'-O-ribosylphosphate transferase n=1 Tax=Saccharomycodes ludwigii TaxID=36035 RepID=UPI001E89D96D|nr:hypothetical protein SCDLUD_001260 [Saccharomycodes ludwigii]KAH3903615.1 hypothetical protein SCDLUD_001260 [Saccharomycodes ludwigii]